MLQRQPNVLFPGALPLASAGVGGFPPFYKLLKAAGCCWLAASWLLAAALLRLLFLLANACETLPGSKTAWQHGPKGRTDAKIYVFRGRNVPSEILQKYHFSILFPPC